MELTKDDLKIILFLVKNRLHYESGRRPRFNDEGNDVQNKRTRDLMDIREKLEIILSDSI